MNFGSDEFYWRLKNEFYGPNNDAIHAELFREVAMAARSNWGMFRRSAQDYEDAVQAAQNKVFTFSIHIFLKDEEMETADPSARNAWLYTVVKFAMTDEYRRQRSRAGVWTDDPDAAPDSAANNKKHEGQTFVHNVSINGNASDETPGLENTLTGDDGDYLKRIEFNRVILERVGGIFTLDAGAEKLIVAAYCMLTNGYGHDYGGKGLNKAAAHELDGCTVAANYKKVKALMRNMGFPVGLMLPLRDRIKASRDETGLPLKDKIMTVDKDMVTKYVNDVRTRGRAAFEAGEAENARAKEEEDDE